MEPRNHQNTIRDCHRTQPSFRIPGWCNLCRHAPVGTKGASETILSIRSGNTVFSFSLPCDDRGEALQLVFEKVGFRGYTNVFDIFCPIWKSYLRWGWPHNLGRETKLADDIVIRKGKIGTFTFRDRDGGIGQRRCIQIQDSRVTTETRSESWL